MGLHAYGRAVANLIEKLAGSVPAWGTRLAYGEKITVDGHELVPVALVAFGLGGGEGVGESSDTGPAAGRAEGNGGGAGGCAIPLGAYVGGPGGPRFRPNTIALIVAAGPWVSIAGLAAAQVIRALRVRR